MVERRTRRRFMAAFKAQGGQARVLDGCSLLEVAAELGLSTEQLDSGSAESPVGPPHGCPHEQSYPPDSTDARFGLC